MKSAVENWLSRKNLQTLNEENAALRKTLTEVKSSSNKHLTCPEIPKVNINGPCACDEGWDEHGGKCYYFSTNKSSWTESRDECRAKGGDLVKIDNWCEQIFLKTRLNGKMDNFDDMFWIGLTDAVEEGRWLWLDGSPLNTSLSFWADHEPDNWTHENPDGEHCVRLGEEEGEEPLKTWYDKFCKAPNKSICEKWVKTD
ncbi:hepatic lectin-like [Neolamprologus brichardi]|uniref:hepatic lectin-like n=1 Tax=Neolamprologus brichardi TaxID=32507 RepID=UPI001643AD86|nr:hepatic lectin-like [Neolamprologus brichardi]